MGKEMPLSRNACGRASVRPAHRGRLGPQSRAVRVKLGCGSPQQGCPAPTYQATSEVFSSVPGSVHGGTHVECVHTRMT